LRSNVIGCEANYELTKKGVKEDFSEIEVFGQENGPIGLCYISDYIRFQIFSSPQTRRQVSAHVYNLRYDATS